MSVLLIPWTEYTINHVRTWYDLQYAYRYNPFLRVRPNKPDPRNYINQQKRNYIQRLATNMKDGDGVAKVVRKFEKHLADNISYIPKPLKLGAKLLNVQNNLLSKDDEKSFLEKLQQFKGLRRSSISAKTKQCLQMINKHVDRRVRILKRIQKLSRKEGGKISKFLASKKYEHSTDPKS